MAREWLLKSLCDMVAAAEVLPSQPQSLKDNGFVGFIWHLRRMPNPEFT
jgi:hypothetical protein